MQNLNTNEAQSMNKAVIGLKKNTSCNIHNLTPIQLTIAFIKYTQAIKTGVYFKYIRKYLCNLSTILSYSSMLP